MPTLNWIQETTWDRYWERGSSDSESAALLYCCRVCGQEFISISDRDRHELNHPVSNPTIFVDYKEVCAEEVKITSPVTSNSIYLCNVDFVLVNGVVSVESDLIQKVATEKHMFLEVRYGNANLERRLKINVCIADHKEIKSVEDAFAQCFGNGGLNDTTIITFTEKVKNLQTVKLYSDGLVRYLQGLMAKDNRSEIYKFDVFVERFNQSTSSLKSYKTGLSSAVRAIVNFNRNDFTAIGQSGIPFLDCAVDFFHGGELLDAIASNEVQSLPVDYATEFILLKLLTLYKKGSLEEIEAEIQTVSPKYLSLQDKAKFDYICWRKSIQVANKEAEIRYQRLLRNDEAFAGIV